MSTFRVNKNVNYTVMSNHHLQDKRLSLKAKVLLSYMLSLPDDWDYSLKGLTVGCKDGLDSVQQIPIDTLHPFTNHPFKVLDDEAMTRTVESIAQYGVLAPLIARPRPDGDGYEIISGHRRQYAAKLAGLDTLPVIVRQMPDDAAVILMVDSNLQREHILPSERAFA